MVTIGQSASRHCWRAPWSANHRGRRLRHASQSTFIISSSRVASLHSSDEADPANPVLNALLIGLRPRVQEGGPTGHTRLRSERHSAQQRGGAERVAVVMPCSCIPRLGSLVAAWRRLFAPPQPSPVLEKFLGWLAETPYQWYVASDGKIRARQQDAEVCAVTAVVRHRAGVTLSVGDWVR